MSSDDSDYEPAPISKPLPTGSPPPVPPPRAMTFCSSSSPFESSVDWNRNQRSPRHLSLFHTMRKSIGVDLKVSQPEGPVGISQFITKYSAMLPCQVKLARDSQPPPSPFPSDGPLNLHFIKHAKVVVIADSASGEVIYLPLNSAAKLSVLYDPDCNMEKAMSGYSYNTVRDLVAQKPLPSFIKATRSHQGGSALTSVSQGEILRVIGTKTFLRTKQLRVQNIHGESKILNEKCAGCFTTAPAQLSLPVSSLLDLGISFPAKVVFPEIPSLRSTYVMERTAGETCLVASDSSWKTRQLFYFEIGSDMQASVEVVQMDFLSRQELLNSTEALFGSFFTSAKSVVSDQQVQLGLRDQMLPGREQEGVQLVQPISIDTPLIQNEYLTKTSPEPLPETEQREAVGESEGEFDGGYAVLSSLFKSQDSCEGSLQFLHPPTQEKMSYWTDTGNSSDAMQSDTLQQDAAAVLTKDLSSQIDKLSLAFTEQLSTIVHELEKLKFMVNDIQKNVKHLQNASPVMDERNIENRKIIADMDCKEVVCVLERLDLPEYKEAFLRERVDGQVLLQLTEDVLCTELGVDSKLHRIRIMNLVAGRTSVDKLCSQ